MWLETTDIFFHSHSSRRPKVPSQGMGKVGSFWRHWRIICSSFLFWLFAVASNSWCSSLYAPLSSLPHHLAFFPFYLFCTLLLLRTPVIRFGVTVIPPPTSSANVTTFGKTLFLIESYSKAPMDMNFGRTLFNPPHLLSLFLLSGMGRRSQHEG